MFRNIFYLIIIIFLISPNAFSNKIEIISKVNNQIITNQDIINEINYLKFLNPKLEEIIDTKTLNNLGKSSITKEIIKKEALEKILDIDKDYGLHEKIEKDLILKKKVKNRKQLIDLIHYKKLSYKKIFIKLKNEALWNEFIYEKYKKNITINEDYLIKRIKEQKNNQKDKFNYFLFEILFEVNQEESVKNKLELIKSSINKIGFNNTAITYGISDSAKFGGEIGWIKETQMSESILNKIKDLKTNDLSEVIQTPSGYLVLKVSKKEKIIEPFDEKKNLSLLKNYEINRQLNQFSLIHYKRLKKNSLINDYK
tara:strand:+ start:933 stop:1868 length:936 start_codon:yes stop_codon:yes gene_type:complete